MSTPQDSEQRITALKNKLSSALDEQKARDDDFKSQSAVLTTFINKLSLTTKGLDKLLDNKLAKLRSLFSQGATFEQVELLIKDIGKHLQQHSSTNEQNIRRMHEQFKNSGLTLQKINGLPSQLRRQLRALMNDTEHHKDALVQYIPIMSQLLSLYDSALKAKTADNPAGLLQANKDNKSTDSQSNNNEANQEKTAVSSTFIKRFVTTLNNLTLPDEHAHQIAKIKSALNINMSNDKLFEAVLTAFDVLRESLQQEKNTAKVFLYTLSETLTSVQSIVKSTISASDTTNAQQEEINKQLQTQIDEMSRGLEQATSLTEIKTEINEKLKLIANSIEKKVTLEHQQQLHLAEQLEQMTQKVNHLESQSVLFEKRIQDQKAKSMQDALTKLANRAAFDDYFSKKMVLFHQQKFDLAVAVLDLDNFKNINDTYGHTAGDKTLQVIANTLKKELTNDAFICRYGGEEFVLIFSNVNKNTVIEKLNLVKNKIARLPFRFKNNNVSITTSIGVCHVEQNDNIHLAFDRADTALYQAKAKGKNTVVYL